MDTMFYSTGQAARTLGITQDRVRQLCEAGAVTAEITAGGQWRVPKAEIDRLKRDGLPQVARPLPGADRNPTAMRSGRSRYGHPALLAEPSLEVVGSGEEVAIVENLVRKRRLERELEETEDWFRDREASDAERIAEQEDAAQARIDARQAEREKMKREAKWMQYALNSVPCEARGEMDLAIHNQVRAALGALHLNEPDSTVRRIVDGAVAQALAPWRRRTEIERAIEEACDTLPIWMKGYSWAPSDWDIRARRAAAKAIESARPGASFEELKAMAVAALRPLVAEFEAKRAAEDDNRTREQIISSVAACLGGDAKPDEREGAIAAVSKVIAEVPVGSSQAAMVEARDRALTPFKAAIDERGRKLWQEFGELMRRAR